MAGEHNAGVSVQNVGGDNAANIGTSLADQAAADAAAAAAADPNSAASLGVTEAQYAKFYNAETKVYNWQAHAVEGEYRAKNPGQTPADDAGTTPAAPTSDGEAETIIAKAGLNIDTLEDQIIDTGDIDQASYDALQSIGFPETMVKDYIESISDRAARQVSTVIEAFGGDANLEAVQKYAAEKYTEAELDDIDVKLNDKDQFQATVDMLRHGAGILPASSGVAAAAPNAIGGGGDAGVKGYASEAEMISDMKNPKYKVDPLFRQNVTAKAAAATYGPSNPRAHSGGL